MRLISPPITLRWAMTLTTINMGKRGKDEMIIQEREFFTTFLMGILIGLLCGMALGGYLYDTYFLI